MPVTRPAHGHSLKLKLGCTELVRIFQCVGTNMGSHLRRDVSTCAPKRSGLPQCDLKTARTDSRPL